MGKVNQIELPDDLLDSIRRRAAAQNISIEELIVRDLALAEREQKIEDALLLEIRREREAMAAKGVNLKLEDVEKARQWGRILDQASSVRVTGTGWRITEDFIRCARDEGRA